MATEEIRAEIEALAEKILSQQVTPQEAVRINKELNERFASGNKEAAIMSEILISTGAGETLLNLIEVAEYEKEHGVRI